MNIISKWIYQSFFGFIDMKILGRENFFYEKFKINLRKKNYNFGWHELIFEIAFEGIAKSTRHKSRSYYYD